MKRFFLFAFIAFIAVFFVSATKSSAQVSDSTKLKPVYLNEHLNPTYRDLQLYFLDQEKNFKDLSAPLYLYSISFDTILTPDPAPRYFRLGYDYFWGLNAHNISIGINPFRYKESGYNIFLSGRVGFGSKESKIVLKDEVNGAKINSMFGAEAEVESPGYIHFVPNLKFFGGLGFSYVKPENFTNPDSTQSKNFGTAIDPFLGVRYYLAPKNVQVKFALQAKIGFLYTNGIKHLNDNAPSLYYGIGANITSSQSFTKKGDMGFMKFESGLFISPASGVIYGQFTQPYILLQNLSVGVNGHIGSGAFKSVNNNKRVNMYWGVGVDLRFFGYDNGQIFKPYLGVMFQDYGYQFQDSAKFSYKSKILPLFRIGTKMQLGRKSNWCLDVNAGVPLSNADTFMVYNVEGVNKELKQPVIFDINIGLVYKIKFFEEKRSDHYMGKVEVYKEADLARLEKPKWEPLPQDIFADTLIEKKIYIAGEPQTVPGFPHLDVSDIKILRFTYDSKSAIDKVSPNFFYTIKDQNKDSLTLLIAMFDKERCNTKVISNDNMYVVFNDLNKCRYFGFNYDINKRLQPETTLKDSLALYDDPPYYGNYKEFIRKLHWLDSDVLPLTMNSIDGKVVQADILRYFELFNANLKADCDAKKIEPYTVTKENFRFAYAIYPAETLDKIKQACKEFGVSIMFRYDINETNKPNDEVIGFTNSMDGNLIVDPDDAAFFSNLIHGSEIYASPCFGEDLLIDDFVLGKDYLTDSHKARLEEIKKYNCEITDISGFTDKVEFTRNAEFMNNLTGMNNDVIVILCPSLKAELESLRKEWQSMLNQDHNALPPDELCQRGLAWKRIKSTLDELYKFGFNIQSIKTHSVGIDPATSQEDTEPRPRSRKVVMEFSN